MKQEDRTISQQKQEELTTNGIRFKTNVQECELAHQLTQKLLLCFPHSKINFDLHDCDKILRVEGP